MAHVTQLRFNLGSHLALELEFRRVYGHVWLCTSGGWGIASSWSMADPLVAAVWTVNELWATGAGPNRPAHQPNHFIFWLHRNSWMNKQVDRATQVVMWK